MNRRIAAVQHRASPFDATAFNKFLDTGENEEEVIKRLSPYSLSTMDGSRRDSAVVTHLFPQTVPSGPTSMSSQTGADPSNDSFVLDLDIPSEVGDGNDEEEFVLVFDDEPSDFESLAAVAYPGLMKHQLEAFAFIAVNQGNCIIADEMGLGKTAIAIAWNDMQGNRTLVVCPSSVKFSWALEIRRWAPNKTVHVAMSANIPVKDKTWWKEQGVFIRNDEIPTIYDFFVVSYDGLGKFLDEAPKFNSLIIDECHLIKNPGTARAQSVILAAKDKRSILALSGTPMRNRPEELWTILNLIKPRLFHSWWEYSKRYCDATDRIIYMKRNGKRIRQPIRDTTGASNIKELHEAMSSFMLRRRVEDVLDLPAVKTSMLPVEWDSRDFNIDIPDKKLSPLETIGILQEELGQLKADHVLHEIFMADDIHGADFFDYPIVFFYHHKSVGDMLEEQLGRYHSVRIDGTTPDHKRARIISEFQEGKISVILCSIMAAGVGITLTAAATGVLLQRCWTPADEEQALGRLHRIGQTKTIRWVIPTVTDSIDEAFAKALESKAKLVDGVVDGKATQKAVQASVWRWLKKRGKKRG